MSSDNQYFCGKCSDTGKYSYFIKSDRMYINLTCECKSNCLACNNSGISYLSDGVYGACLDCNIRCVKCEKKHKECICKKLATRLSSIIPTGFAGMTDEQREAVSSEYEDLLIRDDNLIILNHLR
jgi:hypothetical protein